MSTSSVTVSYDTPDTTSLQSTNQIHFNLRLTNSGVDTAQLSDVRVRYWFTADGNQVGTLAFTCPSAGSGSADFTNAVTGTFAVAPAANVTSTSDSYLELSFSQAAGALLGLSTSFVEIQSMLHGPGSAGYNDLFNETNDYSFDITKPATGGFQPTQTITAYVRGVLVWGCEPAASHAGTRD
jgi:hypothetical protein